MGLGCCDCWVVGSFHNIVAMRARIELGINCAVKVFYSCWTIVVLFVVSMATN